MDLALGSAAGPHDIDLHAAAFEFAVEPTLLLGISNARGLAG
jgi:hypothetical protein